MSSNMPLLKGLCWGLLLVGMIGLMSCDSDRHSHAQDAETNSDSRNREADLEPTENSDSARADAKDVNVVDAHESVPPKVLWSKGRLCADEVAELDWLVEDDFFYARIDIDGQLRDVLVALLNAPIGSLDNGPSVVAVAMLDLESGNLLRCDEFPDPRAIAGKKLLYDSTQAAYFFSYGYHKEEEQNPSSTDKIQGAFAASIVNGAVRFHETEERNPSAYGRDIVAVTASGQFVTIIGRHELVSRDAASGEVLWRIDGTAFGFEPDITRLTGLFMPAPDRLFVAVYANWKQMIFEVDEQGRPTKLFEASVDTEDREFLGPMLLDGKIIIQHSGDTLAMDGWQGDVIHREVDCRWPVTLSPTRIACLRRTDHLRRASIVAFDVDGSNRVVAELDHYRAHDLASHLGTYGPWIIAGADDHVIMSLDAGWTDTNGERRSITQVLLVDLTEPNAEPTRVELEKPEIDRGTTSVSRPILTPDGKLVVSSWGYFFAIQTDISGLANAPYPRGVRLGGNDNRGFVPVTQR